MPSPSAAQAKRNEAADARRVASMFPSEADRERLLRHAEELEAEAEGLDRQAAAAEPHLADQRQPKPG